MSWLPYPPLQRGGIPLFCLPHAGGTASGFLSWRSVLPPTVEVWPVQLPGREARLAERPRTDMDELAREMVDVLRPFLGRSFAMFGHSMGAQLAFATTCALRAEGLPLPVGLFLSGGRPPSCAMPPEVGPRFRFTDAQLHDYLRATGGTSPEVFRHPELLEIVCRTLRGDLEACETYRYGGQDPVPTPISAFGGLDDAVASPAVVRGWQQHTTGEFRLREYPGGHFFLLERQPEMARAIAADLAALTTAIRPDHRERTLQ